MKDTESDEEFFGKSDEKWDWKHFKSTEGFKVSDKLLDWIIGQDRAIRETKLCIDEWIHKLKWLEAKQWWKAFEIVEGERKEVYLKLFGKKLHLFNYKKRTFRFSSKSQKREYLPAGPFLALFGDAGTGKSLLGRAMSGYMTDVYKKNNIGLFDVCTWENRIMPSEPKVSIHPTPEGKGIVKKAAKQEAKRGRGLKLAFRLIITLMIGIGVFILGYIAIKGTFDWMNNIVWDPWMGTRVQEYYEGNFFQYVVEACIMVNIQTVMAGIMAMSMGGMLYLFSHFMGGMGGNKSKGIGGAENTKAPKLLIDNSSGVAPFIDATGHGSSQLFGSIAWDPYQTGDLGTPEHQRVSAGDVHRAHLGILYIDEVKNLTGAEAVTLLTVLEDGQLPIALRSHSGMSGDTAAMSVATEPVPCMTFLIIAGNMDSLCFINMALMDRIRGYGKVVYMNNDMENTVENRRKYVQFICQEIQRFHLLPFSRDACVAIIDEARKKSGYTNQLVTKFRPMISIIKTASILAMKEGKTIVSREYVSNAIDEHCKSVTMQQMEAELKKMTQFRYINPESEPMVGHISGLAVSFEDDEMIGMILPISASYKNKRSIKEMIVTGVATSDDTWVQNSIKKVTSFFTLPKDHTVYIDFMQSIGTDGPSAGVAMTLVVKSVLENKKIRQDVAVTGEINLASAEGKIIVTPVGGVHAKIMAAQMMGFSKVCIPKKNYELNINPKDYKIKVIPCETLDDYEREVFA
jgi:lon-related putative ATP-dependent protease